MPRNPGLTVLLTLVPVIGVGCGSQRPGPLPESQPTLTVCEAIGQSVGQRIRVRGEYDGFTYETGSTTFSIPSTGICSPAGGGMVWVSLHDRAEATKADNLNPRDGRKRTPGDLVTVEGTVESPPASFSRDRAVTLADAIIPP